MSDAVEGTQPTRAQLRRSILEFLATANRHQEIDPWSVTDDDNLFDLGLVDSLTLAELLVTVERLSGLELDLLIVEPETFFTLRGLLDHVEGLRWATAKGPL
jgi:acyl carrier protein